MVLSFSLSGFLNNFTALNITTHTHTNSYANVTVKHNDVITLGVRTKIRALATYGHTTGHMSFHIFADEKKKEESKSDNKVSMASKASTNNSSSGSSSSSSSDSKSSSNGIPADNRDEEDSSLARRTESMDHQDSNGGCCILQ